MERLSKPVALLVLVLSAVVALTAPVVGVAAVALAEKPAWALFGFELVILIAAAMGVLLAVGRFRDGPALALACIAGTIFVGAVLGWASVAAPAGESRLAKVIAGIPLTPLAAVRIIAAAGLALAGAYCVLSRKPAAWRSALIGALLGSPAVLVGAALVLPATRGPVAAVLTSAWGAVIAFVVLGALLAASAHLLIRGFEIGAEESAPPAGSPPAPPAPPRPTSPSAGG